MAKEWHLQKLLEETVDEATFLVFVSALIEDRQASVDSEKENPSSPYGSSSGGWEHNSLESFLSAAHRWSIDTNFGESVGLGPDTPWKKCARFLLAGKSYE